MSQPPPRPGTGDIWLDLLTALPIPGRLQEACWERRAVGIFRYGTPLQIDNDRDMRLDAHEEALDLAVYLWAMHWRVAACVALVLAWATMPIRWRPALCVCGHPLYAHSTGRLEISGASSPVVLEIGICGGHPGCRCKNPLPRDVR